MRKTIITAGAASALALAVAGPASASVSVDSTGHGFVGKGDVQSAFGLNNNQLQDILARDKNAYSFSAKQGATQPVKESAKQDGHQSGVESGTQIGTQAATQSATQSAHWIVSCTIDGKNKTFENDGTRDGSKTGTRSTSRNVSRDVSRDVTRSGYQTGFRTGTLSGTLSSAINGDPRPGPNQFTGFNLNGVVKPAGWEFKPGAVNMSTDAPTWTSTSFDPTFDAIGDGSYSPTGDGSWAASAYQWGSYSYGDVTWTGWVKGADSDGSPADCLKTDNPNDNQVITNLVNEVTYGTPDEKSVVEQPVVPGNVVDTNVVPGTPVFDGTMQYMDDITPNGPIVPSGTIKLSVTGPNSKGAPVGPLALN